jgi:cytosine/adenosine deaminase-related metal-dependent hydrolase
MSTLLAKNAEVLVTMDGQRRELKNAGIYVEGGFIKQIGLTGELPATADVVLDLSGQIVLPGFVNTHHHLNQTLTRNLPAAQNNNLFPWLQAQYRIWARTTEEASRASTLIGLAELALSGCTTVFDHTYVFKNGNNVDCQIQAAKDIGVRFHASRGSMSLGQSQGGLPPDDCVENESFIIRDSERVIKAYHETSPGAMTRNGQRLFDLDTWRSCITRGLEVCGPKWPRKLSPGFTLGHSRPH